MRNELALVTFLLLAPTSHAQAPLYVDAAAPPGGDGSPAQPFRSLQDAADVAVDGTEVFVSGGDYRPFDAPAAISLIGDPAAEVRIRFSPAGPRECVIRAAGGGTVPSGSIRIERVVFDGLDDIQYESALHIDGVHSPTHIEDCIFRDMKVPFGSAALQLTSSGGLVVERCDFTGMTGPLIDCIEIPTVIGGDVTLRACRFVQNRGTGPVLIMLAKDASLCLVEECTFDRNEARILHFGSFQTVRVERTAFLDTSVPHPLQLVTAGLTRPLFLECEFRGPRESAGLPSSQYALLSQCDLVRSRVHGQVGGRRSPLTRWDVTLEETLVEGYDSGNYPLLASSTQTNCTIVGNRTAASGGILSFGPSTNCIVWGNEGPTLLHSPNVQYSLVQGGAPGTGNLNTDPLFVGPLSGNYALRPASPCIGAGTQVPGLGANPDLGAFQFTLPYTPTSGTYCEPVEAANGCVAQISGSDFADLAPMGTTDLQVADLPPGTFGLFFLSTEGSLAAPGTFLCVGTPSVRSNVFNSGGSGPCGGQVAASFTAAELQALGFAPGDYLRTQFLFRDALNPNGLGLAVTAALEMVVAN